MLWAVSLLSLAVYVSSLSCDDIKDKSVPCVEVPRCSDSTSTILVDQLSTGLGASVSSSSIDLCFDDTYLRLNNVANGQKYLTETPYTECNDAIFNSNVAEVFIAPHMEEEPHCYNELDISPFDVMFDSGIYNQNLNQSGIVNYEFDCATSGILHSVTVDMAHNTWTAQLSFPWSLVNCPYNCPLPQYCGHSTPNNIYRANFYRINELVDTAKCSTSTCEYMAWNPTMANPPAFHVPTKFGYLVLMK